MIPVTQEWQVIPGSNQTLAMLFIVKSDKSLVGDITDIGKTKLPKEEKHPLHIT